MLRLIHKYSVDQVLNTRSLFGPFATRTRFIPYEAGIVRDALRVIRPFRDERIHFRSSVPVEDTVFNVDRLRCALLDKFKDRLTTESARRYGDLALEPSQNKQMLAVMDLEHQVSVRWSIRFRVDSVWWGRRLARAGLIPPEQATRCLFCSDELGAGGESFIHILRCKYRPLRDLRRNTLRKLFHGDHDLLNSAELQQAYLLGASSPVAESVPRYGSPEFLEQFTPFIRAYLRLRAEVRRVEEDASQRSSGSTASGSLTSSDDPRDLRSSTD